MDSFTENLLTRARERQKLLEDYNSDLKKTPPRCSKPTALSQPNLNLSVSPKKNIFLTKSEGNLRQNTTTHISSDFTSHKSLNIQNDAFNMEIKVSSADNIHVEVQIEECDDETNGGGLRQDAKNRLNRLGKLYAGGEDADISSPIHQTEAKFYADGSPTKMENPKTKRGLSKLADLAERVNQFEDDLTPVRKERDNSPKKAKKSWKPPAPQPPEPAKTSNTPKSMKYRAPDPPKEVENEENQIKWDKKVLDSLESQGFTRTESSSKLVFKYTEKNKENIEEKVAIPEPPKPQSPQKLRTQAIANKAALFESSPSRQSTKDPALLSVSERKALFEKNKGTALLPKAPFAMATPIKKEPPKEIPKKSAPSSPRKEVVTPRAAGIASTVAALFEQKSTISQEQIENNVREQRKKEMDLLLNRFHKTNEIVVEEEDCVDDVTEKTAMIDEKSKKVAVVSPKEKRRSSGNKRCITGKGDSPKVAAVLSEVKRIKVSPKKSGRLYPSLTDIESVTETEVESPTPNDNSSTDNSFAESDDANTSFGRDILRVVCKNQTPQKRPSLPLEESASDLSDVLDEMDDYIDEALAFNGQNVGPTPPKQDRKSPIESSNSFKYQGFQSEFKTPTKPITPKKNGDLPTHVVDGNNVLPLTHTVSFYRKQQTQASTTPVKHVIRATAIEELPEEDSKEEEQIRVRIRELRNEVTKQEMIISQTSQALNLCNSTPEFMGSTEQVEAERVLLVATHRRHAALLECQRLEVEKTLKPQTERSGQLLLEKGTLTLSKIVLPLKHKYVTALSAAGGKGHHVVCLVKYADQVLPTQLVSTIASNRRNPELELQIPGTITLKNIYSDFTITFEVYCLQAQEEILPHEVKYHIKKPNTKSTPKKSKQDSRLIRPLKESPAGPQVVRSPTFALMGYVVFSLQTVNNKHWSLNNTPSMSPLEGTVEMSISYELCVSIEHRGFLTMFEDISGFGAWHRRWCLLKGDILSYWKYPDDEKKTPPINSVNLRESITKQVGPVSREICARLHTFLLETERDGLPDKETLVTVRKGSKTVIRHLLSADTREERIEWCKKLNSALAAINLTK